MKRPDSKAVVLGIFLGIVGVGVTFTIWALVAEKDAERSCTETPELEGC